MIVPTPEDLARDLATDLALCEAATPGPWRCHGDEQRASASHEWPNNIPLGIQSASTGDFPAHCYGVSEGNGRGGGRVANARFIAAARTAHPAAIRRALAAEAKLALTYCAYCGHEEPVDGDGSKIAEHIRACPKHPMRAVEDEVERLRAAIRRHRDQRGDDRCHADDGTLYAVLPEGDTRPERETAVTLENCTKYIECRQTGREYVSPQRRIEELERMLSAATCRIVEQSFQMERLDQRIHTQKTDNSNMQLIIDGLAERVVQQSNLLSKRAEK